MERCLSFHLARQQPSLHLKSSFLRTETKKASELSVRVTHISTQGFTFHLAPAHPAAGITQSCKALGFFFFQLCNEWFREQLLHNLFSPSRRDTASTVKLILHKANHRKFNRGKNTAGVDYPEVLALETCLARFALPVSSNIA